MNSRRPPAPPPQDEAEAPLFDQIRQAAGDKATDALSRDFGGRRLYIRRAMGPDHPITVSAGADAARVLGEQFSGRYVDVPLAAGKRIRILELRRGRVQVSQIARQVGCSERHVYKVLAEQDGAEPEPPQPGLFD